MAGSGESGSKRETKEQVRLVLGIVALVVLVAFVLDNRHEVKVGFVVTESNPRLIWVLVFTAVLGAAVDRLVRRIRSR